MSDAKHNTAFTAGGHLHNAREEKKCTLLCQQLFQYYGNALFGKKVKREGAGVAQRWSFVCLAHTHLDEVGRCPRVVRAHICDACVAALARSLRGNWASSERVQGGCLSPIGMLPIVRVEAALSEQRQKGPSPQTLALRGYTAFPRRCLLNEAKPAAQRQSVNKRAAQWRFY